MTEFQNTSLNVGGVEVSSIIPYSELKRVVPDRKAFLNPHDSNKLNEQLARKEDVAFLPTYLMETHMQDEEYQKAKYKIVLMGILKDGRRANVILDGIEPFFEVKIDDGTKEAQRDQIADVIERLSRDELTTPFKKSLISAKPFKYYQKEKSKYLRLYYTKTKNRQAAINFIRKEGFSTTSDDLNSYYRVVCRDHLTTFSSWANLHNYTPVTNSKLLKGETYRLNISDYKIFSGEITPDMLRDKSMSMCWDIETWSPDGDLPRPENKTNAIFCLSATFHWVHDKDAFLKICFCDYPANARPGYLSVICGTELNILKAFGEVYAKLRPEFIFGFNDSDYDWPWIIKRASQTKGTLIKLATNFDATKPWQEYTDESVMKYNYKKEHVKVEATSYVDGFSLMMHGYIPIDVRTIFRQLYPTAEQSSLKWFLAKNKLGGKEDMPYERLFKIYAEYRKFMDEHGWNAKDPDVRAGNKIDLDLDSLTPEDRVTYNRLKSELGEVNSYCVVDAVRCHDLVKIRSVIMDKREVSHKSYCSVYDAFYRANGVKVRNLTIAIGQTDIFKTRFSNINNAETEDGKYPGGFVLPPKKGLKTSKLSIEERIRKAKLYADQGKTSPKDNPCADWLTTTPDEVKEYHDIIKERGAVLDEEQMASLEESRRLEGKPKLPKKFKEFLKEPIGRPITGLDFSSLYPSLIRTYNYSPEYCILDKKLAREIEATGQRLTKVDFDFNGRRRVAYFIWHNNKYDPKEEGFQFGIYPYILDGLFNERAALKKKMKVFDHRKEQIEAMSKEEQDRLADEYADVVFNKNYLNCKQNALKVFMNTFYGEAGNKLSPFFVLEVAGGITTYGKQNIQFAHAFVKEAGCNVYYGDSVTGDSKLLTAFYETATDDNGDEYELRDESKYSSDAVQETTIENLFRWHEIHKYNAGKEISFPHNYKIWSDKGWTKIYHVIRHLTDKKLYKIVSPAGSVTCTSDHSLLDEDGDPIKPGELVIGVTKLLYKEHPGQPKLSVENYVTEIIDVTQYDADGNVIPQYVYDVETENHHFGAGDGCLIVHNTDSLYLSVPEPVFRESDIAFYTGACDKLAYWTKVVEQTFTAINPIRDGVNKAFLENNGTKFLSMAYEEVLFPVAFTAKKKYFGIAHENIANFKPKDLFIRGLEVKKRGVSELLKKIFTEIMWMSVDPTNVYDLVELVLAKIDEIYVRKWNPEDFIQTGVYRPTKNNVKINRFVERMKERKIEVKPNERFDYVIVKRYPYTYDTRGRKKEISIGDKLEMKETVAAEGMEIDLDYYMQGSVNGQLARLITYHEMFEVDPIDNTAEEHNVAEVKAYKNACKFVENYCDKYYAKYNTFGKTYQKIYKTVSKYFGGAVSGTDDLAGMLLTANVDYEDFETWFVEFTDKAAEKMLGNYGEEYITEELAKVNTIVKNRYVDADEPPAKQTIDREIKERRDEMLKMLQKVYYNNRNQSIKVIRDAAYKETMSVLRTRVRESFEQLMVLYKVYNTGVESLINVLKEKLSIGSDLEKPTTEQTDYKFEDFNVEIDEGLDVELTNRASAHVEKMFADTKIVGIIGTLKALYGHMVAAHLYIKRTNSIVDYLKRRRDNAVRAVTRPDDAVIRAVIQRSIAESNDALMNLNI
jgi:DNA polymerase elongation subunit (family B)